MVLGWKEELNWGATKETIGDKKGELYIIKF